MTTQEIQENNKLIAQFMGFEKTIVRNFKGKSYDYMLKQGFELIKEVETTIEGVWCEVLEEQDLCMVEDLKFHSSWDWLMPVVEKIESLKHENSLSGYPFSFEMGIGYCMINFDMGVCKESGFPIAYSNEPTKIQAAYKSISEFIAWYNQNKTL